MMKRALFLAVLTASCLTNLGCERTRPPAPAPQRPEPPPPPVPPAPAKPETPSEAFRRRLAEQRARAVERLEKARLDLAADAQTRLRHQEELKQRLAGRPLSMVPRNGPTYPDAILTDHTFTDVEFESGGRSVTLPWDTLAPASVLAAADLLYAADDGARQFERGRFLLARRLWQEAADAFERAIKLDETLRDRVWQVREPLQRLIAGQDIFGGAVKRPAPDRLVITYDFGRKEQLNDFTEGLHYTLSQTNAALLRHAGVLHAVEFLKEVTLEIHASIDGPLSVAFFAGERGSYEIVFSSGGIVLRALKPGLAPPVELARNRFVNVSNERMHDLQIAVRERALRVRVDGQSALDANLPEGPDRGRIAFKIFEGQATIRPPLVLAGAVDRRMLDKRFAEAEVVVRRAADPDLREIEEVRRRNAQEDVLVGWDKLNLSADDPYLLGKLATNPKRYEALKNQLIDHLKNGERALETLEQLNRLTVAHPDVPSLWYLRALFWFDQHDLASAGENVKTALALFPDFAEAHALGARVRMYSNDCDGALAAAEKAIAALPDHAPAYVLRALAGYGKDPSRIEAWMEDARLALRLQPANREAAVLVRALRYQTRGPRDLGCRFDFESEHYRVTTDISAQAAKTYARRLEAAFSHFSGVFKHLLEGKPSRKPRVAVFNTAESFHTYLELLSENRDDLIVGVYSPRWNELILFEDADLDRTLDTLYHEAFHHFTTLLSRHTPPYWFNEGLAEYMAGITIRDGNVVAAGRILPEHLSQLREGVPASFESLMCQTPSEFYSGNRLLKYAQAWSMVYFLFEAERGKHRPLVERYFAEVRSGKTAQESFETVFAEGCERLQADWTEYVKTLR